MYTIEKEKIYDLAEEIKNIIIMNFVKEGLIKENNESKNSIKENVKENIVSNENIEQKQLTDNLNDIISLLKTNKNVAKPWWGVYNKKFKSGDIVYISSLKKFGIFLRPSNKENKVRVRLLKKNKNEIYTTDWLFNIDDIELVKHKNRLNKKFIENDSTFLVK